jgi:hypothetical protein
LHGHSPERIHFLRKVIEEMPPGGLQRYADMEEDGNAVSVGD